MKTKAEEEDEMPTEIDFSRATRGHFAGRLDREVRMVVIEPDVAEIYRSSEQVNRALRGLMSEGVLAHSQAEQKAG